MQDVSKRSARPGWRRAALAMAAAVAALGLSGCGTEKSDAETGKPQVTQPASSSGKIDVNTATKAELGRVPGVSDKLVDEFLEHRPFKSSAHFREEMSEYISDSEIDALLEHLQV